MIGFNGKNVNFNVGKAPGRDGRARHRPNAAEQPADLGHPNVVLAVFMDGHTQPITKNTPAPIVKRLATRDDGQQIGDF